MKRFTVSLAAAALVLSLGVAAHADETTGSAPATTPAPEAKAAHHGHHHKGSMAGKESSALDLNSASKEDLMKLPGVDDATADKIVAARPFAMRSELVKKSVVSRLEYSKIKSKVNTKKS